MPKSTEHERREKQFIRKVDLPEDRDANIAFCNCLHFFRVTSTQDAEIYARCHQRASTADSMRYSPLPAGFPVHAGTSAHVLGVLVLEDDAHDIRNAAGIIRGVGVPGQARGRGSG